MTTLHVVVGELIPKSFAIFATEKYALHTAGPLRVFYRITYPVSYTHLAHLCIRHSNPFQNC